MSETERCTVCSTALAPGAVRCPACGAVRGEDNRCPHCSALAAVQATSDGRFACMACGKPREVKPGTAIVSGISTLGVRPDPVVVRRAGDSAGSTGAATSAAALAVQQAAPAARARSTGFRMLGIAAIAFGVVGAAAVAAFDGGLLLATVIGAAGVGLGAWSMRAGAAQEAPTGGERARIELAILELAEAREGILTVTDVSRGLGLPADQADAALSRMTDGSRVSAEVTPDGLVRYVFRELRTLRGKSADEDGVVVRAPIRARVAAEPDATDLEEAEAELEAFLGGGVERDAERDG